MLEGTSKLTETKLNYVIYKVKLHMQTSDGKFDHSTAACKKY